MPFAGQFSALSKVLLVIGLRSGRNDLNETIDVVNDSLSSVDVELLIGFRREDFRSAFLKSIVI
jgi:hypothetical protein